MKKNLIIFIKYTFIVSFGLLLGIIIQKYVFIIPVVPTTSMSPTIQAEDRVFVTKLFDNEKLSYGDIIIFHPPVQSERNKLYLKRVIGIEGDIIEIKNSKLYINNQLVQEPFIKSTINYNYGPIIIPKNKVFVLGDNRNNSYDSHLWKETPFVDISEIKGKGLFAISKPIKVNNITYSE